MVKIACEDEIKMEQSHCIAMRDSVCDDRLEDRSATDIEIDERLVEKARNGDPSAFEMLIQQHAVPRSRRPRGSRSRPSTSLSIRIE
jgi:hypothetical protein